MTDQLAAASASCTGNTDCKTPAIDNIAQNGILFEKAYCTFPLCTPSRGSLFTGFMPHEIGVMRNEAAIKDQYQPFVAGHIFRKYGYDCAYGGKWHVPELSIPEKYGFNNICGFNDIELADKCREFLKTKRDNPFFLVASFDNPHNICEWAREQVLPWGPVEDVHPEECPTLPANFAVPPYEPQIIRYGIDRNPRAYSSLKYADPDWWRRYIFAYYRLVEKVDVEIGKILTCLDEENLREKTVVIFLSDHGEGLGAHQWKQKTFLYEEAVRVPFIISDGRKGSVGCKDSDHLISIGLDLVPTLCDYAGIPVADELAGASVKPLADGSYHGSWRDHLISETAFADESAQGRMVRSGRYKYVCYNWGRYREQLFDLEMDPGEMVNIALSTKYTEILNEHRRMLKIFCETHNDSFAEHYARPGLSLWPPSIT
jgi:arylsulfatase A-like enzyme